jgi:hypothetical protein
MLYMAYSCLQDCSRKYVLHSRTKNITIFFCPYNEKKNMEEDMQCTMEISCYCLLDVNIQLPLKNIK